MELERNQETEQELTQKNPEPSVLEEQIPAVPETQLEQALEALLFASGDSVPMVLIAQALCVDLPAVDKAAGRLTADYEQRDRGMQIVRIGDKLQMTTRSSWYPYIRRLFHSEMENVKLTETQLETLAIIAYRQPVTKMEIEEIRGVHSDAVVNRLAEYGLIEEKGRLKTPGRPVQFGTTESFMRYFNLSDLSQLPHMEEFTREQQEAGDTEETGAIPT